MTQTIHKFELCHERLLHGVFEMKLPDGARIVHFGEDLNAKLCVWAMVNVEPRREVNRRFLLAWTGDPFNGSWLYIGCCKSAGLVWHLLETAP